MYRENNERESSGCGGDASVDIGRAVLGRESKRVLSGHEYRERSANAKGKRSKKGERSQSEKARERS